MRLRRTAIAANTAPHPKLQRLPGILLPHPTPAAPGKAKARLRCDVVRLTPEAGTGPRRERI